jgi:hypothetical protein
MKSPIFWDITPCSSLRVSKTALIATCSMVVSCLAYFSTLNMVATCHSDTPVDYQRTTRLIFQNTGLILHVLISVHMLKYTSIMRFCCVAAELLFLEMMCWFVSNDTEQFCSPNGRLKYTGR